MSVNFGNLQLAGSELVDGACTPIEKDAVASKSPAFDNADVLRTECDTRADSMLSKASFKVELTILHLQSPFPMNRCRPLAKYLKFLRPVH